MYLKVRLVSWRFEHNEVSNEIAFLVSCGKRCSEQSKTFSDR